MSSIILRDVCLDYVMKTGSESIKKTAVHLLRRCTGKNNDNNLSHSSYRALNNINLKIEQGDRIGILGRNGAGKSTLLRVLAKIYKPHLGQVEINGKVSTLFDVNLGMNIEATGYENIVNLAMMRGMKKKEALKIVPDIEVFTELGNFLNQPVRTYSSGMRMKLAFAVSTAVAFDIMLIDEVIGVGDVHFIVKTRERLENLIEKCQILVLTTHTLDIIKRLCNKVIILEKGEIFFMGDVVEGINVYQSRALAHKKEIAIT